MLSSSGESHIVQVKCNLVQKIQHYLACLCFIIVILIFFLVNIRTIFNL